MFYRPHPRVRTPVGETSLTRQEHKQECDIHYILKQYQRTGIITHVQTSRPTYTDLPSALDFQESMNIIMAAENAFESLPSSVRDHFGNDPTRFLAAFADPSKEAELRELGLLREKETLPGIADALQASGDPPTVIPKGAT